MAKKKYTRKQLRQPDEFISASNKAWDWLSKHVKGVAVMAAVTLLIVGAAALWRSHIENKAKEATTLLHNALEIQQQLVIPGAAKLPKKDGDPPRFETAKAKNEAALKAYNKVLSEFAESGPGRMALLLRAGVYYDLGQQAKAVADYEAFLTKTGTDQGRFRLAAIEGLAYAYEAQKAWDKALKAVSKLERKGQAKYTALFHEARIYAAKGDKAEAIKRYKEVADKASARSLANQAGQRLAALESK